MTLSFIRKAFLICTILIKFTAAVFAVENDSNTAVTTPLQIPYVNKYSYVTPVGLKSLFALERTLYESLSLHASKSPSLSKQLEQYLGDYAESTLKFMNSAGRKGDGSFENLSWNPILAFRTVWRFVKYLRRWAEPEANMPKSQASKFKDLSLLIAQHYNPSDGPTLADLVDAQMALIKLVDVFSIDIHQFAAGNISSKDVGVGLTAAQCIKIGWFAIKKKLYVTGVEFMEAALDKVEQNQDVSVQRFEALQNVKSAYTKHNEKFDKEPKWESEFFTEPVQNFGDRGQRVRGRRVVSRSQEKEMYEEGSNRNYRFQSVCKGTFQQPNGATSKLFCWYEHQVHPTFMIGPLKSEFVSPETVKFHQLISATGISELKKNKLNFKENRVLAEEGSSAKDFNTRLGGFTELHPTQSSTARLIADLVGRTSGLEYTETNIVETLHLTVYTPGSFFSCHADLIPEEKVYKHRMATFMVYLSNVEQGGGTGFCDRGHVVTPEVGSAIFWYNMLSSGEMDDSTNHCSCPVVFGEKWVATAWIYMGPQSHLQCDSDPSKKLEYLVNKRTLGSA